MSVSAFFHSSHRAAVDSSSHASHAAPPLRIAASQVFHIKATDVQPKLWRCEQLNLAMYVLGRSQLQHYEQAATSSLPTTNASAGLGISLNYHHAYSQPFSDKLSNVMVAALSSAAQISEGFASRL